MMNRTSRHLGYSKKAILVAAAVVPILSVVLAGSLRRSQVPAPLTPFAYAQSSRPLFDATSVKRNTSESGPGSLGAPGGHLMATNVTLRPILKLAYRPPNGQLFDYQLIGAPKWIDEDRFDIEAKPEGAPPIPREQFQLMLQALLEDRFRLKTHHEMRELPVYNLISKDRPKIQLSEDQTPPGPVEAPDTGPLPRGAWERTSDTSGITISAKAISISTFIAVLQDRIDRRIVDKTNLNGLYDIRLHFKPEPLSASPDATPADPSGALLFTVIEEQLGLRLESAKGPVEVLVIDRVERPSEN